MTVWKRGIQGAYPSRNSEVLTPKNGLHYLDLNTEKNSGIALVTTVTDNYKDYIKKEIEGAIKAREM